MKWLLFLFLLLAATISYYIFSAKPVKKIRSPDQYNTSNKNTTASRLIQLKKKVKAGKRFGIEKGYSTQYGFFIDMRLPSGSKRFFIYDLKKDSLIASGLVAHGSCRTRFLEEVQFSNVPECGCSAEGKYKIGYTYKGQFGKAFKLHGLDSTNSNAFKRTIVLHAYDCVPDDEVYPQAICNSLGCPMVSYRFLETLRGIIESSKKPVLLWMYN